jgi:transcriptional regulator of NAD metabolism
MDKLRETKASLLADLTGGIHLHTLASSSEAALLNAEAALNEAGFLVEA